MDSNHRPHPYQGCVSVADMFADVIERVHNYKEISSIFFK